MSEIDFSKSYNIAQKPTKGDNLGMDKYNQSMFPSCTRFLCAGKDPDTGKYITGLDIYSKDILSIKDDKERKAKQEEITKVKDEIETYYGQPDLLRPTNQDFWGNKYGINLEAAQDGKIHILIDGAKEGLNPSGHPLHKLALIVMKANGYIPMNKEEANDPRFYKEKLKITSDQEVEQSAKESNRRELEKYKYLNQIFADKINYDRAYNIAYAMGLDPKPGISEEVLQENIFNILKIDEKVTLFIQKSKMSNEDLEVENTFLKGIKLDIVRMHQESKVWYWGSNNYRDTREHSIEYLKLPSNASRLAELREEVQRLSKKRKR